MHERRRSAEAANFGNGVARAMGGAISAGALLWVLLVAQFASVFGNDVEDETARAQFEAAFQGEKGTSVRRN